MVARSCGTAIVHRLVSSALLGGPPDAEAWAAPNVTTPTTDATAIGSDPKIALMLVMAFFMGSSRLLDRPMRSARRNDRRRR